MIKIYCRKKSSKKYLLCKGICTHEYSCLWRQPKESTGSPEDGIIGNCELSDMAAEN